MFMRPKQLDKVKPDSPMVCLVSRGNPSQREGYKLDNNNFHKAILENDPDKVSQLLLDANESRHINDLSLMNTPLMLALKTGNLEIAKRILGFKVASKLNINQKDGRGLTVLDWACILRANDVIKAILLHPGLQLTDDSYAKAIYFQEAKKEIFAGFLKSKGIDEAIIEKGYCNFYIFTQEPYSDLIYFMKSLCVNLKWMDASSFPSQDGFASNVWFCRCFQIGYEQFCVARNHMPVDKILLTAMCSQEELNAFKEAQFEQTENSAIERSSMKLS